MMSDYTQLFTAPMRKRLLRMGIDFIEAYDRPLNSLVIEGRAYKIDMQMHLCGTVCCLSGFEHAKNKLPQLSAALYELIGGADLEASAGYFLFGAAWPNSALKAMHRLYYLIKNVPKSKFLFDCYYNRKAPVVHRMTMTKMLAYFKEQYEGMADVEVHQS